MTIQDSGQLETRHDLGAGTREVLGLAGPIIVAMCSGTLMSFVDFWMLSHLSLTAAAAIAPSAILVFACTSFFIGVLTCTNTFVSQSFGRETWDECTRYTWQGLWVSALVGLASLALWPLAPVVFGALGRLGHGPELQQIETLYFQWRVPSIAPIVAITAAAGFFQGIGRPGITMVAAVGANALNVLLNWVFIYGHWGAPRMGVAGSALATDISCWVQLGILLTVFLAGENHAKYASRSSWRPDRSRMARLFVVGAPAGLSMLLDVGTWGVFVNVFIGTFGKVSLAASNMATQWMHLSFMPTVGLGIAVTALVGQNIGRRDLARARSRARAGILLGMIYMTLMGVVFFLFRGSLIRTFVVEGSADAEAVVALGSEILILAAIFQLFDAMGIVSSSALKGAGDTRFPMLVTVVLGLAVFLPSCFALKALGYQALGAWISATLYILLLGVALLWRWKSRAWENIDIFRKAPEPAELPARPTPYEPGDETSS